MAENTDVKILAPLQFKNCVDLISKFIVDASSLVQPFIQTRLAIDAEYRKELHSELNEIGINIQPINLAEEATLVSRFVIYRLCLQLIVNPTSKVESKLNPAIIIENKGSLQNNLKSQFDRIKKPGFNFLFNQKVLDELDFESLLNPILKKFISEIVKYDFTQINTDIIGVLYNTLLQNAEQQKHAQHFTSIDEVDIINAFCINENTKNVLDSACGAGVFLIRTCVFLRFHAEKKNPSVAHQELLNKIYGVDLAPFAGFLAALNLSLPDMMHSQQPNIITEDFKNISAKKITENHRNILPPAFDACIGNPPYIRQEMIPDKVKWNHLLKEEWGIKKINQQSDFYVYYLMHTAAFLKEGGRLGYVIASSWLDVSFGTDFQKFLLDHFKIIAIIENQSSRSFQTASINTVILIIEKCSNPVNCKLNNVRFIRLKEDYQSFIGNAEDLDRIENTYAFIDEILSYNESDSTKSYDIKILNQKRLEEQSTIDGKYRNGNWGAKYLRSSNVMEKIFTNAEGKFFAAKNFVDVQYGLKSGANKFFYLRDETSIAISMSEEKYFQTFGIPKKTHKVLWENFGWYFSEMNSSHYVIPKKFMKPLFKTQSEALNLNVNANKLKYWVLMCGEAISDLKKLKSNLDQYISQAETTPFHINKIPSVLSNKPWYNLTSKALNGDFIFPSKIGEFYRVIDNREAKIYCDKVNYVITVKPNIKEYSDFIFLILNSTVFRYMIDVFSRQLTGSQTLSDVDVHVVLNAIMPNPELLKPYKKELNRILSSMKSREQKNIFEELKMNDRKQLDAIIFKTIGLHENDVDELYYEVEKFVRNRNEKSQSLKKLKPV